MSEKLLILSPVYNDWPSYTKLINGIKECFALNPNYQIQFLCVDDCSSTPYDFDSETTPIRKICLNRNEGHQKAIALGIAYAVSKISFDKLVIIDADGEDDPLDIKRLLNHYKDDAVVFAKRKRRTETLVFKLFYRSYKVLFYLLTGKKIAFGNFSLLSRKTARKLTHDRDLFINYSSCILNNKIQFVLVDTNRSTRYFGKSKMNYHGLILHGLGAISIHIERVSTRLLMISSFTGITALICILVVLYIKIFTNNAIPGWATNFISSLILIIFQTIIMSLLLTFIILNRKTQKAAIPFGDYPQYLDKANEI